MLAYTNGISSGVLDFQTGFVQVDFFGISGWLLFLAVESSTETNDDL